MAKLKQSKPGDIWDRPASNDEMVRNLNSYSEFMDVPIEDFLYYVLADMILADLKPYFKRRSRLRNTQEQLIKQVMERLSLLDYGKELLNAKLKDRAKR